MGLMNAIGLQPRNPAPSVTSQGTQTPVVQQQNAETQTEVNLSEPQLSTTASTQGEPTGEWNTLNIDLTQSDVMQSDVTQSDVTQSDVTQ